MEKKPKKPLKLRFESVAASSPRRQKQETAHKHAPSTMRHSSLFPLRIVLVISDFNITLSINKDWKALEIHFAVPVCHWHEKKKWHPLSVDSNHCVYIFESWLEIVSILVVPIILFKYRLILSRARLQFHFELEFNSKFNGFNCCNFKRSFIFYSSRSKFHSFSNLFFFYWESIDIVPIDLFPPILIEIIPNLTRFRIVFT